MISLRTGKSIRRCCSIAAAITVFAVLCTHPCLATDAKESRAATDDGGAVGEKPADPAGIHSLTSPASANPGSSLPPFNTAAASASGRAFVEAPHRPLNWSGLINQSALFLSIEQGFRLGTQPGTREALKGPFFDDWFTSVKSTKGWGDADDFLTNYIGHPMQGSVTGYIFVQNDPGGSRQTFNWTSAYWNSRLKATLWSAIYSTQFELGPISEASIGNVGYPGSSLSGAVDLVMTPLGGLGWQVGEDALDRYLIMRIETWTSNPTIRMLARGVLNPTRSFANVLRWKLPWHRDTRPGIWRR